MRFRLIVAPVAVAQPARSRMLAGRAPWVVSRCACHRSRQDSWAPDSEVRRPLSSANIFAALFGPFWNGRDLERKLAEFQRYYNAARSHASLDGHTPLTFSDKPSPMTADLNHVRWDDDGRDGETKAVIDVAR